MFCKIPGSLGKRTFCSSVSDSGYLFLRCSFYHKETSDRIILRVLFPKISNRDPKGDSGEWVSRIEPGSTGSQDIRMYSQAYMAGPFLRAQNPRKLFNKEKCENKGRRGKVDFWGHFGVPRSGIWPARSGKIREICGDFPQTSFSSCIIPENPFRNFRDIDLERLLGA